MPAEWYALVGTRARILVRAEKMSRRRIDEHALEIDDPLLPTLVGRVDAGERIIDDEGFLQIEK
jgi:hypothetical protein